MIVWNVASLSLNKLLTLGLHTEASLFYGPVEFCIGNLKSESAKERSLFSFVQMHTSRFCDYLGGKQLSSVSLEKLSSYHISFPVARAAEEGKQSGERFHVVLPYVFLLVTRKGTLEAKECILSSQELTCVLLRIQMQSWSVRALMESPHCPSCLPSLPSSLSWQGAAAALLTCATCPFFWLTRSSFSGTHSSKLSIYSQ